MASRFRPNNVQHKYSPIIHYFRNENIMAIIEAFQGRYQPLTNHTVNDILKVKINTLRIPISVNKLYNINTINRNPMTQSPKLTNNMNYPKHY